MMTFRRYRTLGVVAVLFLSVPLWSLPRSPVPSEDEFLLNILWDRYRQLPKKHELKIGVALGGGGARGLAHIGVLKVFQEEDVPISMIAGTSVGALIGALYAAGISTAELETMSRDIGWNALTNFSKISLVRLLFEQRLLSSEKMESYLKERIGERHFHELKIPFACAATDLQTGERIVFREGPVALAARASATIPGLFEPVSYRHRFLVDGGLVSNLPIDLVSSLGAQVIVAIDVASDFSGFQPKNVISILNQAIFIQGEQVAKQEINKADFVIRPKLGNITAMDIGRSGECIDAGILEARRSIGGIKRYLIDQHLDLIWGHEKPPR